jgi:hypothetical protein
MKTRSIMHVMKLEVTEMLEDTKGLITSRISKHRQHNGKKGVQTIVTERLCLSQC